MTSEEQLQLVFAGFDVQALKGAVEVVDLAGEMTIDEDLGLLRRDLQLKRRAVVVVIPTVYGGAPVTLRYHARCTDSRTVSQRRRCRRRRRGHRLRGGLHVHVARAQMRARAVPNRYRAHGHEEGRTTDHDNLRGRTKNVNATDAPSLNAREQGDFALNREQLSLTEDGRVLASVSETVAGHSRVSQRWPPCAPSHAGDTEGWRGYASGGAEAGVPDREDDLEHRTVLRAGGDSSRHAARRSP